MSQSPGEFDLGTARGRILITEDTRGVDRAAKAVGQFEKKADAVSPKTQKLERGMKVLGTTAGLAVVAGFIASVKSAANFEKTISGIAAVSGATSKEIDALRKTALRIGKDTKFSASEAAQAMEELAKAGVSTTDILGGAADATVALAAAGEVALPRAAEIASNAMNVFSLSARDMPKVADLIAGAANASAIDVEEFGQSLQQAGAAAHLAGIPFDDLAVAIAEMGNAGIKGSDAGTSLKTMLLNLNPQTKKQRDLMRDLGIVTKDGSNQFFDATGKAKGLADIAGVLEKATEGMTQQQKLATLEVLFGSDAIRAAAVLTDKGAKGFTDLATSMGKISAADVAAKRMDNLAGDIEQLRGSVETLLITIGEKAQPALRGIVQLATRFVNALTDFHVPEGLKNFGTGILGSVKTGLSNAVKAARNFGGDFVNALIASFGGGGGETDLQKQLQKASGDPQKIHAIAATLGREGGAGFSEGLSKGPDFGKLGKTIAEGLLAALRTVANFGSMIIEWVKSVNWLEIGKQAAHVAVPFIIGFLNELVTAIIDFAVKHPVDMLLFIVTVFPIGRLGGIIAKILSKIPFLRAFAPLFEGLFKLTKPLNETIGKLLGFLGRSFSEGFGRAFPGVAGVIRRFLDDIGIRFLIGVDIVRRAAVRIVGGFIEGLGQEVGTAVRNIGQFIAFITRPFARAGTWLVRRGAEVVLGLVRGVGSVAGSVGRAALDIIATLTRPYVRAATWLVGRGREAITGLVQGARAILGAVGRAAASVIATLTNPFVRAGTWLVQRGREAITGLVNGVRALLGSAGRAAGEVRDRIISTFSGAVNWLTEAGRNVVRGLINGGREILRGIGGFLGEIRDAIVGGIKSLFGIKSPASVMIPLGRNILRGLIKGMVSGGSNLRAVLTTIGGSITGFFKQLLGGNLPGIAVNLVGDLLSSGSKAVSFLGDLLGGLGSKALGALSKVGGFLGGLLGISGGGLPNFAGLGKQLAASLFGWVGAQWNALFKLGMGESGWRNTAQNPNSTAFGIGQFLNSTWALVGMIKTLDPTKQIIAMLKYIKLVYGDPIRAYGAWLSRVPHWYAKGLLPTVFRTPTIIGVGEAGPETVEITPGSRRRGDGGDTYIINVDISGVADVTAVERLMNKRSTWSVLTQAMRQRRISKKRSW